VDGKLSLTVSQHLPSPAASELVLDALGDRTRRVILERLRTGPMPVVEIARGLPVSRPAVSQQLKVLKQASLVMDQPDGNRRLYAVNPYGLIALRAYLESMWQDSLARFAAAAEAEADGR
jgi:DNA-binding transcriptional ArsR family regulator